MGSYFAVQQCINAGPDPDAFFERAFEEETEMGQYPGERDEMAKMCHRYCRLTPI